MYKRSCYFDCCCFNVSDVWNCAQSSLLRRPKTSTKAAKAASQPCIFGKRLKWWACYHHYTTIPSTSAGTVTRQKSSQPNFARLRFSRG